MKLNSHSNAIIQNIHHYVLVYYFFTVFSVGIQINVNNILLSWFQSVLKFVFPAKYLQHIKHSLLLTMLIWGYKWQISSILTIADRFRFSVLKQMLYSFYRVLLIFLDLETKFKKPTGKENLLHFTLSILLKWKTNWVCISK